MRYTQPQHGGIRPKAYWLKRGLQMVFIGTRCVWSRDEVEQPAWTVTGGPKALTTKKGVAQGFGGTYGTGLTDCLSGPKLAPPLANFRSIVSHVYAKTTGGGGLGRMFQDVSGNGLTRGESWYISSVPGVTYAIYVTGAAAAVQWTPSFTIPTGRPMVLGISVEYKQSTTTTARGYLDGDFKASANASCTSAPLTSNPDTDMAFGNRMAAPGNERYFDGYFDRHLIFESYLTDQEHKTLANNPDDVWEDSGFDLWLIIAGWPTMTINDASHGHSTDQLTMTSETSVSVNDASHAQTADAVTLTTESYFSVDDAAHAQTADELALTLDTFMVVADAAHEQTADQITVTTESYLFVDDSSHAHTADNVVLVTDSFFAIDDAQHGHAADEIVLTSETSVGIDDAAHAQTADELTLSGDPYMTIADASHTHTADALTLVTDSYLVIDSAEHEHTADALTLTAESYFAIDDASHAQTADNVVLTTDDETNMVIDAATHDHMAEQLTLTLDYWLSIDDAQHAQTADSLTLDSESHITYPLAGLTQSWALQLPQDYPLQGLTQTYPF